MCGIVAYSGYRKATEVLVQGLSRLEYRGYDSSGLCVWDGKQISLRKKVGRIDQLSKLLAAQPVDGAVGISHTRWATHGEPTDANAHPHFDQSGKLALVHNGVIENYQQLKEKLMAEGHEFKSQTDTEVLAHLVGKCYEEQKGAQSPLTAAIKAALVQVTGTYGIAVMHEDHPGVIVGARRGSPLIVGVGKKEYFLASDVTALVAYTHDVIYLNDFDIVEISGAGYHIDSLTQAVNEHHITTVDWDADAASRGAFPHFMLKEIFEQPQSIQNAIRGRLSTEEATAHFGGLNLEPRELRQINRILVTACGTAMHAGMVGEYLIEEHARIPVEVEFASELRYRNSPMDENTAVFVVSQSGETADSLAAMREVKRKGHRALGICNVVGSTIARESDGGIFLHAGPEVGVAATKSFTSQATIFLMLSLYFGRLRHLSPVVGMRILKAIQDLPSKIQEVLDTNEGIRLVAEKYAGAKSMLFLGRQANYPIAMEGALKLKEISYIHAEAYPSAELKHGVIALISPELPTLVICPQDGVYEKNISNIQEVKARKGPVIAVATAGDTHIKKMVDDVIYVPEVDPCVQPILNAIPLQLFAYHIAVKLGCDVDKPRNLAKSVTVE